VSEPAVEIDWLARSGLFRVGVFLQLVVGSATTSQRHCTLQNGEISPLPARPPRHLSSQPVRSYYPLPFQSFLVQSPCTTCCATKRKCATPARRTSGASGTRTPPPAASLLLHQTRITSPRPRGRGLLLPTSNMRLWRAARAPHLPMIVCRYSVLIRPVIFNRRCACQSLILIVGISILHSYSPKRTPPRTLLALCRPSFAR